MIILCSSSPYTFLSHFLSSELIVACVYLVENEYLVSEILVSMKLYNIYRNSYMNRYLYNRNLKYAHLTPIFWQHNIHLVTSTCQHKYKWILCTEKPVFIASFQDFWFTNINNHRFCFEKTITTYLKTKIFLHATRISSFKYVFIVFFEKKTDAKIYI